jgi:predicted nucleic-acid-binding protein
VIALDTNILLRYFDQGDGQRSPLANQLIEETLSREEPGFISLIVVCELAWVMRRSYRQSRENIAAFIGGLLSAPQFSVEGSRMVAAALEMIEHDIADALIHLVGQSQGCGRTLSFDRRMSAIEGVELLA